MIMLPRAITLWTCISGLLAMAVPATHKPPGTPLLYPRQIQARPIDSPFERLGSPALSSDGKTLVFSALDSNDRSHIHTMSADGGAASQLTSGPFNDRSPRFSPDGRQVAFVSDRSGNADVWLVGIAGGEPKQITNDPADDVDPEWSPDGA